MACPRRVSETEVQCEMLGSVTNDLMQQCIHFKLLVLLQAAPSCQSLKEPTSQALIGVRAQVGPGH